MPNRPSMDNPIDFDRPIVDLSYPLDTFHNEVEALYNAQPKNFISSFFYRIIAWLNPESLQNTSQQIVEITAKANYILGLLPENMHDMQSLKDELNHVAGDKITRDRIDISKDALKQFSEDMDRLFKEVYPHVKDNPFSRTERMPKLVQEYFSPDIKNFREEKEKDSDLKFDQDHKAKRKIAKGKLAHDLGRGVQKNAGSSGTLIILDVNEKPVGIHKISTQDVPLLTRARNFFKVWFGGQLSCLSDSDYAQPLAEKASYILSKKLGFNLAPPSQGETLKGIHGVFQVFISKEKNQGVLAEVKGAQRSVLDRAETRSDVKGPNDYQMAGHKDVFPIIAKVESFEGVGKNLFQKLAIFDYLIGNLDRHAENWLVTLSADNKITNIKAIDNANAIPKKQPEKGTRAAAHQYEWRSLSISEEKFTPEIVAFVRYELTLEALGDVIEEIKRECPGFLDKDMEGLIRLRHAVIRNLVSKESSPRDLALCSTEAEMSDYIAKLM